MSLSKSDKVGCFLTAIGNAVSELDEKFADAEGNIKISDVAEALEFAGFTYNRFKTAYEQCLGKEFNIAIPGAAGKLIELILELIASQGKAEVKPV